jgi:hypothetical protein
LSAVGTFVVSALFQTSTAEDLVTVCVFDWIFDDQQTNGTKEMTRDFASKEV